MLGFLLVTHPASLLLSRVLLGHAPLTVPLIPHMRWFFSPGFGTFVAFADAAPWTPEVPPAIKIQAVARGFQARLFAASKLNWFIYNQLDNDDEKVGTSCPPWIP